MKSLFLRIALVCMCCAVVKTTSCSQQPVEEATQETAAAKEPGTTDATGANPEPTIPEESTQDTTSEPQREAAPGTELVAESEPTEATPESKTTDKIDPTGADAEACRLFTKGPYKTLPNVTEASKAGEIFQDHVGYQMKLKAGEFSYFKFNAFTRRDHTFYFSEPVTFKAQEKDGSAVSTKKTIDKIALCTEVKKKYIVDLPKVSYYFFKVGPVDADSTVTIHAYDGHKH